MRRLSTLIATCAIVVAAATPASALAPSGPSQPESGPGGRDYAYDCFDTTRIGSGATRSTIFEPGCPNTDAQLDITHPVVVLLHGFGVVDPVVYSGWIRHLARRGNVVVFPAYQATLLDYHQTASAAFAVRAALDELDTGNHRPIDPNRLLFAGHSAGGGIAVNLAAMSAEGDLPVPTSVFAVEPAVNTDPADPGEPDGFGFTRDWRRIDSAAEIALVVGDADTIVSDETAWLVWQRIGHVTNRTWVRLNSDRHGFVPLLASHLTPIAMRGVAIPGLVETNAHDYLLWAMLDTLIDCAGSERACELPSSLGEWSDGTPTRAADIAHTDAVPRVRRNSGNNSPYTIYKMLEGLAPMCKYLHGLCGRPPPR